MKNFLSRIICLFSVTIQKIQSSLMRQTKKLNGKIIDELVGLKSEVYSMKNIDDKESNTAKE